MAAKAVGVEHSAEHDHVAYRDAAIRLSSLANMECAILLRSASTTVLGWQRHEWLNSSCAEYFKASYRRRLELENWKSEPFHSLLDIPSHPNDDRYMLPETATDDGILRNLLNDRLFYLAFILARPDGYRNGFTRLLWQIFGTTSPATLVALFQTAVLHGHHSSAPDSAVMAYLKSMGLERPGSLKNFLSNIEACLSKPGLAFTFKPTLWLLKHRLLEVEAEFHEFGFDYMWGQLDYPGAHVGLVPEWPLDVGLMCYVQSQDDILRSVLLHSLAQIPDLEYVVPHSRNWSPRTQEAYGKSTLYVDTAGTGKTAAVLERVRRSLGFYLVAPNVLPSPAKASESLVEPDRAFASRDTYSAYVDLRALDSLNLRGKDLHDQDPQLALPICVARYKLLALFSKDERNAGKGDPLFNEGSATRWLQIQLTCWSGNDPFDVAYRLLRLSSAETQNSILKTHRGFHLQGVHQLLGFDEAQQALENDEAAIIAAQLLTSAGQCLVSGTSLERPKIEQFLTSNTSGFSIPFSQAQLQENYILDEAKILATIAKHAARLISEMHTVHARKGATPAAKDFPLLSRGGRSLGFGVDLPQCPSNEIIETVKHWYILRLDASPTDRPSKELKSFLAAVKKAHTKFLGRIRWTTLFAEELLRVSPAKNGQLSPVDVEDASEKAAERIKTALKARIDKIKQTHWVDELYWTAIEADVFSKTRIISEEDSARLISDGFALLEDTSKTTFMEGGTQEKTVTKARLREPLAVQAVMEYLRHPKNAGLYEKLINRFFMSVQLDRGEASAVGTLAEYVFTAKMDQFLRDRSDEISRHRRAMLIEVLKGAQGKTSGETVENKLADVGEYFLVDPDIRRKEDGHVGTQEWLSKPRSSNFLFPAQSEGPDLLVFLKVPGTSRRILCALQFKTGVTGPGDKGYIMQALHTLALKSWKPLKYKGPVIHIYVANQVDISLAKWQECMEGTTDGEKAWNRQMMRDDDYICCMDRERSKTVFGETFEALLAMMKNRAPWAGELVSKD